MLIDSVIGATFFVWFVLTVAAQLQGRLSSKLREYDNCGLIPAWTFFAPNPISRNYYLMFRDITPKACTPWREAFTHPEPSLIQVLWQPLRREEKALSDVMFHLTKQAAEVSSERLYLSMSYLALLHYVTSLPHAAEATATQFMLTARATNQPFVPLFLSALHQLPS